MVAWEYNGDEQTSGLSMFNMILKDGTRSDNAMTRNGKVYDRYDYSLPQNKRITAVTIYFYNIIYGFRFHLSDGSNWDIGGVGYDMQTQTVDIADNEVIVGFKAKSHPDCPAMYAEWQFITARGLI